MLQETPGRILIVDNDPQYRRSLRARLEIEGYVIDEADSERAASARLATAPPSLAVIDVRLVDEDDIYDYSGLRLAKRATELGIPTLIVTAYHNLEAARLSLRTIGTEPLALDFVLKDEGPQGLLPSIQSALGKWQGDGMTVSRPLHVDLDRKLAWHRGVQIDLSKHQYALLSHLFEHRGEVCSQEALLRAVYGEIVPGGVLTSDKRLERLVHRLREKIEDDPSSPEVLVTVLGRGFRLVLDG